MVRHKVLFANFYNLIFQVDRQCYDQWNLFHVKQNVLCWVIFHIAIMLHFQLCKDNHLVEAATI